MSSTVRQRVYDVLAGVVAASAVTGTLAAFNIALEVRVIRYELTTGQKMRADHEQRLRVLERGN